MIGQILLLTCSEHTRQCNLAQKLIQVFFTWNNAFDLLNKKWLLKIEYIPVQRKFLKMKTNFQKFQKEIVSFEKTSPDWTIDIYGLDSRIRS
jgi:hypothetical protein